MSHSTLQATPQTNSSNISDSNNIYLNWIAGKWQEGKSREWEFNTNPANKKEILGKATRSTPEDVNAAIEAAVTAQKKWSKVPRPQRGAVLMKAWQLLRDKSEFFATLITKEEGKNIGEARGEVQKSINVLEFTAGEGRRPTGQVIPSDVANTFVYTTRTPLGVVGIITPWNFPLCIPVWKIAPALLEGNAIVFKPASLTPATAFALTRLFEEAGVPPGVLNLVYGSGSVVGNTLVDDVRVRGISFTGSNEVGKDLNVRAAKRLAHVQLEMGGKNPVIILADADLNQAAEAVIQGAFGSTGQRCTATSRVIVEKSVHSELTSKILKLAETIRVGDGLVNPKAMGPVVDRHQFESVQKAIALGKNQGAKLIWGSENLTSEMIPSDQGYFIAPTIFDFVSPQTDLAKKEVFGPVLAIIPVENFEEAIEVANSVEYGLSSSLYTKNINHVMEYAEQVETGILHVNSPTVGGEAQAPFGGMKTTGMGGREMGSTGPEFFSEIKTVYIDTNTSVRKVSFY